MPSVLSVLSACGKLILDSAGADIAIPMAQVERRYPSGPSVGIFVLALNSPLPSTDISLMAVNMPPSFSRQHSIFRYQGGVGPAL